ncbi:DUF4347 domain-containing protein [Myxococcus qinghaiensis]|uniref:DUF4347 domain-containing protein n=1 Tax=Myxococcus qinghaiensis TaxID=2906758 RepID=UPI0020A77E0D|nr:DUF4347 domain-containing protein [Myxococcus qinghaiensis]MCP3164398.1 DUF4347 domain-containing protein [Myxococcus qinghaiensis]
MHLTIIGYSAIQDREIEPVIFRVDGFSNPRRRFARCQTVAALKPLVQEVVNRAGPLSRLDIFGHGAAGSLTLGDVGQEVVTQDEATWTNILGLDDLLDDTAEVRLLGCNTGTEALGRRVLRGLQEKLSTGTKRRTVWGAIAALDYPDFGPEGLRREVARQFLISGGMVNNPLISLYRDSSGSFFSYSGQEASKGFLPRGYLPAGLRDLPDVVGDERFSVGDIEVLAFASQRIVGLRQRPTGEWSLFRWAGDGDAPSREQLESQLKNR